MERGDAERMGAIEVLDDQPADAVGGAIDGGVQVITDVLDHGDGRFEQVDLDAAVLVDSATRTVLVADTDPDPLDAVAVARENESQPAPHVLGQGVRHRKSLSMDIDNHWHLAFGRWGTQNLGAGAVREKQIVLWPSS